MMAQGGSTPACQVNLSIITVLSRSNDSRHSNMASTTIDRLIINSPYEEPARHWRYERESRLFDLVMGRRPAGYGNWRSAVAQRPGEVKDLLLQR